MNLLIVEDEIETINGILTGISWDKLFFDSVDWATSMETAMKKYAALPADVVLCDIELPDGSGLDFLEWAEQYHRSVCIIMTCHAEFDYARRAISMTHCRDYVVKPIEYGEMEEKLRKVILEISQTWENDRYQAFGREWMNQLRQEQEAQEGSLSKKELAEQVKSYITANLREEIRLEVMAKKFFISADYLSKVFRKETGTGIREFITEKRMFLARELLNSGRLSISRVAYECGYDNFSYFTKVFKKTYGMTPREYVQLREEKGK